MSEKHTPGKWTFHGVKPITHTGDGRIYVHLEKPYDRYVVEQVIEVRDGTQTTNIAELQPCGDMPLEECEANAELMASAPDLLAENKKLKAALIAVYSDIELQNVQGGSNELNLLVQTAIKARQESEE